MPPFPVTLDLRGRPVVVVGGGAVGRRKALAAAAAGGAVRVVDPAGRPTDFPPAVAWIESHYRPELLEPAALVFACVSPAVNAAVVADASARNLWVCDAAEPGRGNLHLPAVVRSGPVTLAIATGGASPALARRLREKWQAECDAPFAAWVGLLAELRPVVLHSVTDPARRRELLDALADWPWLERVRRDGADAARSAMLEWIRRPDPRETPR